VKMRQSQLCPPPIYSMPSTYDEIQTRFSSGKSSGASPGSSSLFVEADTSLRTVELDPPGPVKRAAGKRETLYSTGNIARKQRLRKKARSKPPKEVTVNILRSTTSVLGRTMHKAKDALENTSVRVGKFVKGIKRGKENQDEFHRYLYDIHRSGYDEMSSNASEGINEDLIQGRRGTWTNLSSVMGLNEDNVSETGLETIQEVHEISDCARRRDYFAEGIVSHQDPSFPQVAKFLHSLGEEEQPTNPMTEDNLTNVLSRTALQSSEEDYPNPDPPMINVATSPSNSTYIQNRVPSFDASINLTPPNSPAADAEIITPSPLKEIVSRDIFSIPSCATYTAPDPIKPSISSQYSVQPEITRSSSHILETLDQPDRRMVAQLDQCERVVSVMSRDVSTYSRGTSAEDELNQSLPVIQAWKWTPTTSPPPKDDRAEMDMEKGKSVRERVRELDMAIDSAMTIEGGRISQGKRGMFARWRG